MSSPSVYPVRLQATSEALVIHWNETSRNEVIEQSLPWSLLRERCPCATCKTRPQTPPPATGGFSILTLAETLPLKPLSIEPIGNYAYHIRFSDGHSTGIYTLEYLRSLS